MNFHFGVRGLPKNYGNYRTFKFLAGEDWESAADCQTCCRLFPHNFNSYFLTFVLLFFAKIIVSAAAAVVLCKSSWNFLKYIFWWFYSSDSSCLFLLLFIRFLKFHANKMYCSAFNICKVHRFYGYKVAVPVFINVVAFSSMFYSVTRFRRLFGSVIYLLPDLFCTFFYCCCFNNCFVVATDPNCC